MLLHNFRDERGWRKGKGEDGDRRAAAHMQ
jgi:hypothetical protein